MINKSIYLPREDSFLLNKWVKKLVFGDVLDMGTGSGILAKTAKDNSSNVLAVDINPVAVRRAIELGVTAIESDLFNNVKGKFDWIIFNPPYLPEDKLEPKDSALVTTGGKQGHELIARFLKQAKLHLKPKGNILLLFSSETGNVLELIKQNHYASTLLESQKMPDGELLFVYKLEQ